MSIPRSNTTSLAREGMIRTGQNKRKEQEHDEDAKNTFSEGVRLEMLSDEEKLEGEEIGEDEESDDQVDEFPEIDTGSDSGLDDESDEVDEESSPSGSESDLSSDVHIFPKPKDVISEITGQPKRVYPEIEPDYDSDSSTEDVRVLFSMSWNDTLTRDRLLRIQIVSGTFRHIGTMISPTSATTSVGNVYCVLPRVMNWTNS